MYEWGSENWCYNHLSFECAMKSQVLHTVWWYISGEAAGEIGDWSPLGVKGLKILHWFLHLQSWPKCVGHCAFSPSQEGRIWPKERLFPCEKLIDGRGSAFCKRVPHNFGQDCRYINKCHRDPGAQLLLVCLTEQGITPPRMCGVLQISEKGEMFWKEIRDHEACMSARVCCLPSVT